MPDDEKIVIELFSGTASFSCVAEERGYVTLTIDNDKRFNPHRRWDIMKMEVDDLPERFQDPFFVWASPPCQCFSIASVSHHWRKWGDCYMPVTGRSKDSVLLVKKTLQLIDDFDPEHYVIENPRGILRKLDFMQELHRDTVTYCQYGDNRMKPTDLWNDIDAWKPRPMCKNGDPCHESAPRGSKTGTQGRKNSVQRARVPRELCEEILDAL